MLKPALAASLCLASVALAQDAEPTTLDTIRAEAAAYMPHVESDVAKRFLASASNLPAIDPPRTIYVHPETREAVTASGSERVGARYRFDIEPRPIRALSDFCHHMK